MIGQRVLDVLVASHQDGRHPERRGDVLDAGRLARRGQRRGGIENVAPHVQRNFRGLRHISTVLYRSVYCHRSGRRMLQPLVPSSC
jgi:hypothetical protein